MRTAVRASCARRGAMDGQERRAPIRTRQGWRVRLSPHGCAHARLRHSRKIIAIRQYWPHQAEGNASTYSAIRCNAAASGSAPLPPIRLSIMFTGLLVAGVMTVTAGWAATYLRKN